MSLFFAELRKVWGGRVFPVLLAILASANLLLLWMGTRPTANQPPAAAYRAVGAQLDGLTMEEKGAYLADCDRDRLLPAKGAVHSDLLRLYRPDFAGIYALAGADPCAAGARQRTAEPCAQPAGRTVENSPCQAGGICCQLIGRSDGAVWGQSCILFGIVQPWPHEPHDSKRSGFDALYHADYRWPVSFSVFTC